MNRIVMTPLGLLLRIGLSAEFDWIYLLVERESAKSTCPTVDLVHRYRRSRCIGFLLYTYFALTLISQRANMLFSVSWQMAK